MYTMWPEVCGHPLYFWSGVFLPWFGLEPLVQIREILMLQHVEVLESPFPVSTSQVRKEMVHKPKFGLDAWCSYG